MRAPPAGRPTPELAGDRPDYRWATSPRTEQVLRYFLTLTGPSRASVSGPTGVGGRRWLTQYFMDFFKYLHVQGLVVLWCLGWVSEFAVSAGLLHWSLSCQLLQCSGQASQVTNPSTLQHASTVMSTRSFQVALRPGGDQFRGSPFALSEILEQPKVLRSWVGWYSTRARST